jgi:ABC-type nitrate/sulfonate/bicarbonate transport system substrate-binding protein
VGVDSAAARGSGSHTRRTLFRHAAAGGLTLSVGGLVAACGSSSTTSSSKTTATTSTASTSGIPTIDQFKPSPGTAIPKATVSFAQWPYGDTTIGFIGIKQGLFKDVGITLAPANGETLTSAQTPQQLLNSQLQVSSGYMPLVLQTYVKTPNLKMIQYTDTYIGNYILASPLLKAKTLMQFMTGGLTFNKAFMATVQQMKGKRVALSNVGANRTFFQTILQLGGLKSTDLTLQVVPDNTIVQLAKAGKIDYAFPAGAAQSVEVLNAGFVILAGAQDLIKGLPPGNASAAGSIGHAGLESTQDYVTKNLETVLRFQSVFYRIIDEIEKTPSVLSLSLPYLDSSAGVNLSLAGAELIFKEFYGMIGFDQMPTHVTDTKSPYYYETVYNVQIQQAVKGGIIPSSANVTPDDLSVAKPLYELALGLKQKCDALKASGKTGSNAAAAEKHYAARNYLDAYRLMSA